MPDHAPTSPQYDLTKLHQILVERFSESELRTLVFELLGDSERISGRNKDETALELVQHQERRGQIEPTIAAIIAKRPVLKPTDFQKTPDAPSPPQPIDDGTSPPFMGMRYFDEKDAPLFFGRRELTDTLLQQLYPENESEQGETFLAIIGASGSGKSSLARAGLIPVVRQRFGDAIRIHVLTPTDKPLKSLANRVAAADGSLLAVTRLMDEMGEDDRCLDLYFDQALKAPVAKKQRVLLLVDQFEELFTQCKNEAERRAFAGNLLKAAADGGGRVTVLLTLRADFYAHCGRYADLRQALAQQQEYIGPMDEAALRQAIIGPAQVAGLKLQTGLITQILRDVGTEPGGLPLLSHALLETWRRRDGNRLTFAGYHAADRAQGAIAQTAETVYQEKLTAAEQQIARHIFLRLTELGEGTQDTRRRAERAELIADEAQTAVVEAVLTRLADERLITADQDSVEVAHEALIREWPTLAGWLEENREGLRLHRRLTAAAREWAAMERADSELYRGARLEQIQEWVEATIPQLYPLEREFLTASHSAAERRQQEKEAVQQRELEAAQALTAAQEQRLEEREQSLATVRRRSVFLAIAAVLAIVAAGVALWQTQVASQRTQEARGRHWRLARGKRSPLGM